MDTCHISARARDGHTSLLAVALWTLVRARDGHSSLLAVALWTLVMLVLELEMVTHHF